jgi:hypothetical protein
MDTKTQTQGDFSIETSGLETPEQVKPEVIEAPKVATETKKEEPKPVEKKEEPKPVEKKDDSTNGDFSIVTDGLIVPDENK